MFSSSDSQSGDQFVEAFKGIVTTQPLLVGFFGLLAFAVVIIALVLYRNHKVKIRRIRSPTLTKTMVDISPVKEYEPIAGFIEATAAVESAPGQGLKQVDDTPP